MYFAFDGLERPSYKGTALHQALSNKPASQRRMGTSARLMLLKSAKSGQPTIKATSRYASGWDNPIGSSPTSTPSSYDVGGASPPVATHANLGLEPNVRNMLGALRRVSE